MDRYRKGLLLFSCTLLFQAGFSQSLKWDGGGGDSAWTNAANWSEDRVPQSGDEVILDNSLQETDYLVILPAGNSSITIRSMVVSPSADHHIEVLLPKQNTAAPALSTTMAPGLVLSRGALFRNASGASSGNAVAVSDSLRILNGGIFIQQSETAHATLVSRLSLASGTAQGQFIFDVPGGASYTVSVSNRTYGILVVSSAAAGGKKNYLSSGSGPLSVRGEFEVGTGVVYALNYSGLLRVKGDLIVNGTLNLSSGSQSNKVVVEKDLRCSGILTETGTGFPIIEWGGSSLQRWWMPGSATQSVTFRVANSAGVELSGKVILPYKLALVTGKLFTSATNLLELAPAAWIEADPATTDTYVEGPVKKNGLANSSFYFPVGKSGFQRWLYLRAATGTFTVEYIRSDPAQLSTTLAFGLDHLSQLEYWSIVPEGVAQASAELSFHPVYSGGVTDLSSLRVAVLHNTDWQNEGNLSTTGTAGILGSVLSNPIIDWTTQVSYLTLAGYSSGQNPLPDERITLAFKEINGQPQLISEASPGKNYPVMRIERALAGDSFQVLTEKFSESGLSQIAYLLTDPPVPQCLYRALAQTEAGQRIYSRVIREQRNGRFENDLRCWPNPAKDFLHIPVSQEFRGTLSVSVVNTAGICSGPWSFIYSPAVPFVTLPLHQLKPGLYYAVIRQGPLYFRSQLFCKW